MLYGRQEIRLLTRDREASLQQIGYVIRFARAAQTLGSCRLHRHRNLVCSLEPYRLLGCYMVKPHGQLVLVSSTPHSAYTPNLSTS